MGFEYYGLKYCFTEVWFYGNIASRVHAALQFEGCVFESRQTLQHGFEHESTAIRSKSSVTRMLTKESPKFCEK